MLYYLILLYEKINLPDGQRSYPSQFFVAFERPLAPSAAGRGARGGADPAAAGPGLRRRKLGLAFSRAEIFSGGERAGDDCSDVSLGTRMNHNES